MWAQSRQPARETTLRPIVRPGAPYIVRVWNPSTKSVPGMVLTLVAFVLLFSLVIRIGIELGPVLPIVLISGAVGLPLAAQRLVARDVVNTPKWEIHKQRIDGEAFTLLEDIDARFAYAEANIKRLPTGIAWPEVDADVRALLWEAAEHAAEVTSVDLSIHEMRYAEDGTPQAALLHSLEAQRTAHMDIMRGIQWEAEGLARTAGNAVAASKVALARTGSLAALRQITPSRRAIVAAGALAEARARLELLADVWAEIDESGDLAAERLDADRRRQLGAGESD